MLINVSVTKAAICTLALGAAALAFAAGGQVDPGEKIDGYRDTPLLPGGKWHLHDPDRPQPRVVTPGASFSQNAPAPSDAEILFDGKDLSKWQNSRGQDAAWKVQDGYVETGRRGHSHSGKVGRLPVARRMGGADAPQRHRPEPRQ